MSDEAAPFDPDAEPPEEPRKWLWVPPLIAAAVIGGAWLRGWILEPPDPPPPQPHIEAKPVPSDPPLSPEVRELLRKGEQDEADGRYAIARREYLKAMKAEPKCFSCFVRLSTITHRMVDEMTAGLANGTKDLETGRWDDAIREFEIVQSIEPDPRSRFNVAATQGLARARQAKARN